RCAIEFSAQHYLRVPVEVLGGDRQRRDSTTRGRCSRRWATVASRRGGGGWGPGFQVLFDRVQIHTVAGHGIAVTMFAVPRAHQPVSAIAVGILIAPSRLKQTQPLSGGHTTQPLLPNPIVDNYSSPYY